tara:strand:+ start:420 stop:614 length:195 start_codon:yes stop_codon:yes gene_type:complete
MTPQECFVARGVALAAASLSPDSVVREYTAPHEDGSILFSFFSDAAGLDLLAQVRVTDGEVEVL